MDFNAAIFDLDGTILDSMDVWEHIDIQFLKKRNLPVPENYVTEICARSFEEAAQYTIDLFGLQETVEGIIEELMLSRLVDTFFSRTSWTMLLYAENHSISVA